MRGGSAFHTRLAAARRAALRAPLCERRLNRRIRGAKMVFQEQFTVSTTGHGDAHDLTARVAAVVERSKVRTGLVHVFNVGSTAAVGTIEFEPGLQEDLP